MAFYAVLTPPPDPAKSAADQLEGTVFLKDGFVLFAFVLTGLWLLSKKLWLAFAVFVALWVAIGFGGRMIGIHPLGLALAQALIGLYLGFEGHAMVERKLLKKGWTLAGVVEGRDLDMVERRFFEHGGTVPASMMVAPTAPTTTGSVVPVAMPVLGLFPDAQVRR